MMPRHLTAIEAKKLLEQEIIRRQKLAEQKWLDEELSKLNDKELLSLKDNYNEFKSVDQVKLKKE